MLHTIAAFAALGTKFAAGTVKAAFTLSAQLIVSAIFTFLSAS